MATTPCTLIIFTEDKYNFPLTTAKVVMKQLFQYGVKEIAIKGTKLYISLSYSPKGVTLKKKFGNLPIKYLRTQIENEEEFTILEKVVKTYRMNLVDEELDENLKILPMTAQKRKMLQRQSPAYALLPATSSSSSSSSSQTAAAAPVEKKMKKNKNSQKNLNEDDEDKDDEDEKNESQKAVMLNYVDTDSSIKYYNLEDGDDDPLY